MSQAGVVLAVCSGPGGIPKSPLPSASVDADGIHGDGHRFELHGGPHRALCLMSIEERTEMEAEGVPALGPGGYGENLLVEGLNFGKLRPGMRLKCGTTGDGGEVVIELLDVRSPCRTLKAVDARFPDLMVGRSGFLARVLKGGRLEAGMRLTVLA